MTTRQSRFYDSIKNIYDDTKEVELLRKKSVTK